MIKKHFEILQKFFIYSKVYPLNIGAVPEPGAFLFPTYII